MSFDFELARRNMVSNQVRPWDVLDPRVLETLASVRRADFVPASYRATAYADIALPLGHGEVMLKPAVEGRILQSLEIGPDDHVLEIGTGSGYFSACLSRLAGRVTSIDIHADFVAAATSRLREAGFDNVETEIAEAVHGYGPTVHFDAIAVTGAVATLPQRWLGWLKPGGRIFAISGRAPAMQALLLRTHPGTSQPVSVETLFETDLPYLQHAAPQESFVL